MLGDSERHYSVHGSNTMEEPKMASQLPEPKGYKLLIALPEPDEVTEGGIIKAKQTMEIEEIGSICGFVLKMGPDAYEDEKISTWPLLQRG